MVVCRGGPGPRQAGGVPGAAAFYVSIFPNSRVTHTSHFLEGAPRPAGSVLTVEFTLDGNDYVALNGGPDYKFTPAISLVVHCDTQEQVDHYWNRLLEGGQEVQCGWLTDKYGISWQVVPRKLIEFFQSSDRAASQRAFTAMMGMRKLDIAALQRAYDNC